MYAVIKSGGKQYRVEEGERLEVEVLPGSERDVQLSPVLVVDGDTVLATPEQLGAASVTARVVGEAKGPKVTGFVYKPKTNQRRSWGHRQRYTVVEITGISSGAPRKATAERAPAKKTPAKKTPAKKAPARKATKRAEGEH